MNLLVGKGNHNSNFIAVTKMVSWFYLHPSIRYSRMDGLLSQRSSNFFEEQLIKWSKFGSSNMKADYDFHEASCLRRQNESTS